MNVLTPSPSTAQHIWKVNFFKWLPYNTQFTNLSKDSHSEAINLISGIKKIYYSSFPCKGRTNKILRFFLKRNLPDRILIHVQIFFLDYFPLSSCSTSWSLPESHFCTLCQMSPQPTLYILIGFLWCKLHVEWLKCDMKDVLLPVNPAPAAGVKWGTVKVS